MKLFLLLLTTTLSSYCCFSQVGINTSNPKALLHIDGAGDNPTSGTISESAQKKRCRDYQFRKYWNRNH